jgi:hypothetical protein
MRVAGLGSRLIEQPESLFGNTLNGIKRL